MYYRGDGGSESQLAPAMLMTTLNYQLYRSTPAAKYATMFLGCYDPTARVLRYCNAGHLPPIIIRATGEAFPLDINGTVVGLFDGVTYDESTVVMQPGDIFVAYSDGVTEPENEFGEFGEDRLVALIKEHRRKPLPRRWYAAGTVHRAPTIAELAEHVGMDPAALAKTVDRFNEFAEAGKDADFGRGDSAYDRYYGDPRQRPNPCLAPLRQAPFYAVQIVPGDLGTKGGLRTDERARVLREDGTAIAGLYAAGNASAAVMGHSYAGAGATIGPAMTFGYIAALDLAGAANTRPSR